MKKYLKLVAIVGLAFLSVLGLTFGYNVGSEKVSMVSPDNLLLTLIFFYNCFLINKYFTSNVDRRTNIILSVVSLILSIITSIGFEFNSIGGISLKIYTLYVHIFSVFIFFYLGLFYIFSALQGLSLRNSKECNISIKKFFIINFFVVFCVFLITFLTYYPGYLTYDGPIQMNQVFKVGTLDAHHPVVHTLILTGCVKLGVVLFESANIGLAIYTIIQLLLLCFSITYVSSKMIRHGVPLSVCIISEAIVILNPVFQIFSVITTKDMFFAAFFSIFIVKTIEIIESNNAFFEKKRNIIGYAAIVLLMCLFRKQGVYVFLITSIILMILSKEKIKCLIMVSAPIVLSSLFFGPFSSAVGIEKSPPGEVLSVPLQQITRAILMNKENLKADDIESYYRFVSKENTEKYIEYISDPIKDNLNIDYYENHKFELIKLWILIGKESFSEYLDSFLFGINGYINPSYDSVHPWAMVMDFYNTGYPDEYKISESSLLPKLKGKLEIIKHDFMKDIPVVNFVCCIAFPFWVLCICTAILVYQRKYKFLICPFIMFLYYCSLFLGPVCCIRYVMPLNFTLPIIISLVFIKKNEVIE